MSVRGVTNPEASGRVLCFGGSFNPIHHGHLIVARHVAERLGYRTVMLIPSARPPHKPGAADLAEPEDRLKMVQLAVAGSDGWDISVIELERKGPSYTFLSSRELKEKMGWEAVHWMIGADMTAMLPQWYRAEELVREVHFVLVNRPGFRVDFDAMPEPFRGLRRNVVEGPMVDISATQIRERVREGRPIDFLTPEAVVRYIVERGLYRQAAGEGRG